MWWVLWDRSWNSTLNIQGEGVIIVFSFEKDQGKFYGGLGGRQKHWGQGIISLRIGTRRTVYSGRLNSKDEKTGSNAGESARSVASTEVGEGSISSRCSNKTLVDFNGGRWWGAVCSKYVDMDENEKCQFSKFTWIFSWQVLYPKFYIFGFWNDSICKAYPHWELIHSF